MWYARQVCRSWASDPVRKSHWLTMPWVREYDITSATLVACGLASTPSSRTSFPAVPSSCLASTMLCVVSGQTVVHSESSNPSKTTLPRNWLSDIGWPNWLVSVKSGAGDVPRSVPRSMFGFDCAAVPAVLLSPGPAPAPGPDADDGDP